MGSFAAKLLISILLSYAFYTVASGNSSNISLGALCDRPLRSISSTNLQCSDEWLTQLFSQLGCTLDFTYAGVTWPRRLRLLMDGDVDLLIGVSETANRREQLRFTLPIIENRLMMIALAESTQWHSIGGWCDELQQQARIMIPARGHYGDKIDQMRRGDHCAKQVSIASQGPDQGLKMLQAGRIDLIISTSTWWASLPESVVKQLRPLDVGIWSEASGIATNNLPPEAIAKINVAILERLRKDDTPCGLPAAPNTSLR